MSGIKATKQISLSNRHQQKSNKVKLNNRSKEALEGEVASHHNKATKATVYQLKLPVMSSKDLNRLEGLAIYIPKANLREKKMLNSKRGAF